MINFSKCEQKVNQFELVLTLIFSTNQGNQVCTTARRIPWWSLALRASDDNTSDDEMGTAWLSVDPGNWIATETGGKEERPVHEKI